MDNVYFPIYLRGDEEFIVFECPGYETQREAKSHAVGDAIMLMATDTTIGFTNRVFAIPCSKENEVALVAGNLHGVSIGVCGGPTYDEVVKDGI